MNARRPPRLLFPPARVAAAWFLVLATALATSAGPAAAGAYSQGQEVVVAGTVVDAEGRPLQGLEVVLSGHRRDFDFWRLKFHRRGQSELTATTDAQGAYSITWRWDRFYNRFRLAAGIRQPAAGEETWYEAAALDLTRAIERGSPVVANLVVENGDEVRSLQTFIESLESVDARRVYQELGKPDKVNKVRLPQHVETTWWYFERGMLYRFVDGQLASSESFKPIEPI